MPSFDLEKLKRQGKQLLDGFTTGQKVMTVLALVAMLGGGYLFMQWASKPSYVPLFTNLDANDASQITEKLGSKGAPYKLEDGGRTVSVPRDRVYQLRLDLTSQGLPSGGGPGYSLLDKQGITTSEFRQRVDYQRAMQGELARTIASIDAVSSASVHLVIPTDDVFAADSEKPSASVLVKTAPGKQLGPSQVQAIVNLVAGSVAEMKPEDVTVADTAGRVLSAPGADGIAGLAGDANATQTAQFEQNLDGSVQQMLEKVIGPGHAVVHVSAQLDFDQRASTTESYDNGLGTRSGAVAGAGSTGSATGATTPTATNPGGTMPPAQALHETSTEETYNGPSGGTTGPLGPDGTPMAGSGGNTDYKKNESNRTYAIDKTVEQVRRAPGKVQRLSVAVMLDAAHVDAASARSLDDAVRAAVGLDPDRGDSIKVTRIAFDKTTAKQAKAELDAAEKARQRDDLFSLLRMALAVLVVAAVLFFAWRSVRKSVRSLPSRTQLDLRELEAANLDALEAGAGAGAEAEEPAELGAGSRDAAEIEPAADPVDEEIATLIDRQPDEVAATLRSWLADRRS